MTVARIPPMILAGCINHMMNIRDTWLTDCLWYWSCIEFRFRSRRLHKAQKSNGARYFHQRSRDQSEPLPAKVKTPSNLKKYEFHFQPMPSPFSLSPATLLSLSLLSFLYLSFIPLSRFFNPSPYPRSVAPPAQGLPSCLAPGNTDLAITCPITFNSHAVWSSI